MEKSWTFTNEHQGIADRLIIKCGVSKAVKREELENGIPHPTVVSCCALWDTGASISAISIGMVRQLGLQSVCKGDFVTAEGKTEFDMYAVNLVIPEMGMEFPDMIVTAVDVDVDFIVGMDIISKGDMAVSNYKGNTVLSFRIPSRQTIDFNNEK